MTARIRIYSAAYKRGITPLILLLLVVAVNPLGADQPPVAKISILESPLGKIVGSTVEGAAPLSVMFSAEASFDPDGRIEQYRWIFDPGAEVFSSSPTTANTFDEPGAYHVSVVVTDNWGNESRASNTVVVRVKPSRLRIVAKHVPSNSDEVDRIHFSIDGTPRPGLRLTDAIWDFGDGAGKVASGANGLIHEFNDFPEKRRVVATGHWEDGTGTVAMDLEAAIQIYGPILPRLTARLVGAPALPDQPPSLKFPIGAAVAFSAQGSYSPYGDFSRYEFDLSGDDAFEVDANKIPTTTKTYADTDRPYARVRVTDVQGNQGIAIVDFGFVMLVPVLKADRLSGPIGSIMTLSVNESRDLQTGQVPEMMMLETTFPTSSGADGSWRVTFDRAGTHVVKLTVGNAAEETASASLTFTIGGGPTAVLTASPATGICSPADPLQVTFSANRSSSPEGALASYEWDLNGDGYFERTTTTAQSMHLSFQQAGTYIVRLRVTDGSGQSDFDTVEIRTEAPPQSGLKAVTEADLVTALNETAKALGMGARAVVSHGHGYERYTTVTVDCGSGTQFYATLHASTDFAKNNHSSPFLQGQRRTFDLHGHAAYEVLPDSSSGQPIHVIAVRLGLANFGVRVPGAAPASGKRAHEIAEAFHHQAAAVGIMNR